MESPFVYGRVASSVYFTNRKAETEKLVANFSTLVNTIVISPRRWGKSSLVKQAAEITMQADSNFRFCFIDMYNVRTEEQFYRLLSQNVLKASSSRFEEILETSKKFLTRLIPKISFNADMSNELSLSADWEEIKKQPDEIIDLAENIAKSKKFKFVVCIDEFQNLSSFDEPLEFQKKIRSHWQYHENVSYCLYGSKRHMMIDVFTSQSMPFYKFGDIMFLSKISDEHWIPYIIHRFSVTGKSISATNAGLICTLAENHSFYVQQLAHLVWTQTMQECTSENVTTAFENLLLQLGFLYQSITDSLSNTQVYFLNALINNENRLSSKDIIRQYKLGTSANVSRIKQALENKEIIDIQGEYIEFLDPMYKSWLKKHYFRSI